jgi:hypothetical protein
VLFNHHSRRTLLTSGRGVHPLPTALRASLVSDLMGLRKVMPPHFTLHTLEPYTSQKGISTSTPLQQKC